MSTSKQAAPTPVRLPAELKTWLMHEAVDRENGSLNKEIVRRLEESRKRQLARGEAEKVKGRVAPTTKPFDGSTHPV